MPSLTQVTRNAVTVEIEIGDYTINVEYYPLLITDKMFAQLQGFSSVAQASVLEKFAEVNCMLVAIMKSWDLTEDDEITPIPITVERLKSLSPVIKLWLIQKITGNIDPESIAPQKK